MKEEWIKYLCDPIDKSNLKIEKVYLKKGGYVISGDLRSKSGNLYRIHNGVPILLGSSTQPKETVDSFAYEWETFDFDYGKKGWLKDLIIPLVGKIEFFKDKVVIDCGAGSGRQSLWMAEAGAKFVFSIELSDSATSIVKKVINKRKDKIFVIQGDIAHLPIKRQSIPVDVIYCLNVIQHTKNPAKTILEMSTLLNKNTVFLFNIYLKKGKVNFFKMLSLVRKLTRYVPQKLLKSISFVTACFSVVLSYIPKVGSFFTKSLPIKHGFRETWLSIYDILGAHKYQKFYTEGELKVILKKSNLNIIKKSRYGMILGKN